MLLVNSLTFYEKMIIRITVEIIGSLIYDEKLKNIVVEVTFLKIVLNDLRFTNFADYFMLFANHLIQVCRKCLGFCFVFCFFLCTLQKHGTYSMLL